MNSPDRYAVIGHPVHHSRSPVIHARFAAQTGQSISYTTLDAAPEQFFASVRGFFAGGGKGLNVTIPHKEAAATLADELSPRAERAGAVNTLVLRAEGSVLGDNTDGVGLVRDLVDNHRVSITGQRILVLGAGGAARGILAPLLERQPEELTIVNRNKTRAIELAARFAGSGRRLRAIGYDELGGPAYGLVINATAASLAGALPPLLPAIVDARTICYDLAYARDATPFSRWAQQRGCARAIMGLGMLVEQAAESFLLWRGVRPDTLPVIRELNQPLHAPSPVDR